MAKNITLTLARGIEIFTALGRRTAKNWKVLQLTNAINMGLATIATDEVLAGIKDTTIVADIKALLKATGIDIVDGTEAPAAEPAPAAKEPGKKAPAKKAPVAAAEPVVEAPPAKAPAKKAPAKKGTIADTAVEVAVDAVAAKAPAKKAPGKKAPVAAAEAPAPAAEPAPAPAKKTAAKKAPVAPAAPAAEAKSKCVGVRYTAGRPYVCGQVLLEHGVLGGLTPEMVAAVDAQYGDANPRESMFAIRNGWHVLRGYMGWETADAMAASHDMAVEAMPVCVGARFGLTRPYFAGVVLAEFGIQNGVTQEMINAVEAYMPEDAKNPRETGFAIRNGWHILRGYFGVETDAQAEARDTERAAA
jgi:hypothetical protein